MDTKCSEQQKIPVALRKTYIYVIYFNNSFISYEQATNDIHLNPVLPFVSVQNDTAYLATIDANPSATSDIDVTLPTNSGTLQTEDDVIGLIMAMG